MPLTSMTGFADLRGGTDAFGWSWEARSVNGRGLDLRLRLPEGFEAVEAAVRAAVTRGTARGSVTIGLRLGEGARATLPRLSQPGLEAGIAAALAASALAAERGLDLAPMTAADVLSLRGVLEAETHAPSDDPELAAALLADVPVLVAALGAARAAEGAALGAILAGQIDRIAELTAAARLVAEARGLRAGELLRERVAALLAAAAVPLDTGRLAQELALLAVKGDVTEELDRLAAHVVAARALLSVDGPAGRKFDFLTQEFNREANTLCSKAGAPELTAIGLEMKVVVDQMREQVQNVE